MSSSTPITRLDDRVFAIPRRRSDMAAPSAKSSRQTKINPSKKHQRSRSGCYTCRLRRKKCDEVAPSCRACRNLGLRCDYKRPNWWSDADLRREQKDFIKNVIKRTQLGKKKDPASCPRPPPSIGSATPPGLCHSASTPDGFSDSVLSSYAHSRSASVDQSPYSSDSGLGNYSPETYFPIAPHHRILSPRTYGIFTPYEVDVKTETQYFVNEVQTRRDSTLSSFSTFHTPPSRCTDESPALSDTWVHRETIELQREEYPNAETIDFEFFDLPQRQNTPTHASIDTLDDCDRPLLEHFRYEVAPLLFPILDVTEGGAGQRDIILPALLTNKCYLHCCLSVAGMHLKAMDPQDTDFMNEQIMRHRYATITELCASLDRDADHEQILEATLAMIFHPSTIVRPDDILPDVAWHQHLQAAKSLAERLQLPERLLATADDPSQPASFSMTLIAWIDILGATMQGKSPVFAHVYREMIVTGRGAGLSSLMGCDDNLMFLISEIACLEERKLGGLDDVVLCKYIERLGTEISVSEARNTPSSACTSSPDSSPSVAPATTSGPRDLIMNVSNAFRIAARIYLCTMVPGFDVEGVSMRNLVDGFVNALANIPAGINGFDRCLAWPFLIAGAVSLPDSSFRTQFEERCASLEHMADIGSLGRVRQILQALWTVNDASSGTGLPRIHWRVILAKKGWDCLLI